MTTHTNQNNQALSNGHLPVTSQSLDARKALSDAAREASLNEPGWPESRDQRLYRLTGRHPWFSYRVSPPDCWRVAIMDGRAQYELPTDFETQLDAERAAAQWWWANPAGLPQSDARFQRLMTIAYGMAGTAAVLTLAYIVWRVVGFYAE